MVENAQVSLSFIINTYTEANEYVNLVRDTQGGTTRTLTKCDVEWRGAGKRVPLYASDQTSNPQITSFTLINADTDQPVACFDPIAEGAAVDFAKIGTKNLSIRANASPATVGSVRFAYDGQENYHTENALPYAIQGDQNGGQDYFAWTPAVGIHTLTATPYTGAGATGTTGRALSIRFTVVEAQGLTAEYYDNADFTNLKTTRTDAQGRFQLRQWRAYGYGPHQRGFLFGTLERLGGTYLQ